MQAEQGQADQGDPPKRIEYTIAAAALADVVALRALADVCWYATYAAIYTSDFIDNFLARAYSEPGLRHAVTNPAARFLVAKTGDALVGFAQVGPAFHPGCGPALTEVDLFRIYLHPAHQRRGLGRRLLDELEAWVLAAGHDRYGCYVHRQNLPARAFYSAQGFIHHPERDTQEELYLVKSLS